jgi:uncharacterized membrane protein (UPF0127 family)
MYTEKIKHFGFLIGKTTISFFVFVFFLLFTPTIYGFAQDFYNEGVNSFNSKVLVVGDSPVKVKVADNRADRMKGLSGVKDLKENHGLFFIFEESDTHGIWMKDMNFSIDVIWFNDFGEVVYIVENMSPDSYPKVYKPDSKSKFILELNAGFVKKNNIKIGDSIDLF